MASFGIISISHGRPEVLRLWCASIYRLREQVNCFFPVVVVGDAEHESICSRYNILHIAMENKPAEAKWNKAMDAMRIYDVDYTMISGSDDLMSKELLLDLMAKMEDDYDVIGIKKIWFYCAEGLYKGRVRGIEQKRLLGVCKTINKRIIEKASPLWRGNRSWGMDADCQRNISPYVKTIGTAEGIVFDIKTGESLNKYTMVQNKAALEESWPFAVEETLLWDIMGEEERQILKNYERR